MVIKMAYIEIKTINGRQYKYLRKTVRDGKKMKHITLKYLGPVNPVYKIGSKRKKTNASIYARAITEKEKEELEKATKSTNAFTKDRARIILLSSENFFAKQIAEKINCEARKVRLAIKEFNRKGLNALQRGKAKGAIPKFTETTKKIILLHFSKEPRKFGYHFTTWTLPRFRKHLVDYNVVDSISIETLRQILMKAGAKLKRSKRWQYSPDKEFDKKNKE
jgi:transposase